MGVASMNTISFATKLAGIGVLGVIASVIWWYVFFSKIDQGFGGKGSPPFECLYSSGGPCGFVTGIANAAGAFAYNPMLLYISGALIVLGIILDKSNSAKKPETD